MTSATPPMSTDSVTDQVGSCCATVVMPYAMPPVIAVMSTLRRTEEMLPAGPPRSTIEVPADTGRERGGAPLAEQREGAQRQHVPDAPLRVCPL